MKRVPFVLLFIAAACAPAATQASPKPPTSASPTPAATTAAPTATATSAPTASPTAIPLPSGATIAAASGGVVWMYLNGDHLFMSLNRGDTWSPAALPPDPRGPSLAFISAGEGWWLSPGSPGTQCSFQDVVIWKTDDGAKTWRKLNATGIDRTLCKDSIQFSGPGVGFITTSAANNTPVIYRTSDGGVSWSASYPLASPPGYPSSGLGANLQVGNIADFGSVLYADVFGTGQGTLKHYVYRSTDRGATWAYDSPTLLSPAIVFVTPTRWIQIQPQDSRETTDRGGTWHLYPTDYSQAAPIAPQIVFGDASTGYATVRGSIQRTTDGGAHWTVIKTPGT